MARAIVEDLEDEDLSSDASEVIPAARTKLEEKARPKQLRRTERQQRSTSNDSVAVVISGPSNPWEYAPFRGDTTVESVLEEWLGQDGKPWFKIEFEDGSQDEVSALLLARTEFWDVYPIYTLYFQEKQVLLSVIPHVLV